MQKKCKSNLVSTACDENCVFKEHFSGFDVYTRPARQLVCKGEECECKKLSLEDLIDIAYKCSNEECGCEYHKCAFDECKSVCLTVDINRKFDRRNFHNHMFTKHRIGLPQTKKNIKKEREN